MSEENILARIRGEDVAAALAVLPDCATAKDDVQESTIDVLNVGKVRFTCKRKIARQGKNRFEFWSATRAVKVD